MREWCTLCAVQVSGVLDDMSRRGVKYLPQYCVDNAVVKVADPVFVGYCIEQGADVGGKAVAKVCLRAWWWTRRCRPHTPRCCQNV